MTSKQIAKQLKSEITNILNQYKTKSAPAAEVKDNLSKIGWDCPGSVKNFAAGVSKFGIFKISTQQNQLIMHLIPKSCLKH